MNSVIDAILTRKSIRAFSDKRISDNDLKLIAKCAVYAPSALNRQLWHFTVLHDKEKIANLARVTAKTIGAGDSYCFYAPDALIIASAPRNSRFGREDCSCALQNIFLAAHSLGIGSVWINQLCDVSDEPEVRTALNALDVPSDHIVRGMAALGYPASAPSDVPKNEDVITLVK